MAVKEMPMTEAIAYISGQTRKAYSISALSTFLLISTYILIKSKGRCKI